MSKLLDSIKNRAIANGKKIVLAEGEEERVIRAAEKITEEKIAKIILLGDEEVIREKCPDVNLDGVEIINPVKSNNLEKYANTLYELRKNKGMSIEQANELAKNVLYFATLMIKNGDADGMVAGAINSTGNVLRSALQVVKTAPGISTVSSCFLMVMPNDDVYIYGDCGVNIAPNAPQLADIAIASAKSMVDLVEQDPKVALLSFSTKGSAKHESVDKVIEATKIAQEKAPDLMLDGELQVDAALVPVVQQLKAPESKIKGQANVLIFPDLNAGNIGYKLTQRLAGATAIGPICQGLAKPVNDLSRGCNVEDIVCVVAITAVQAGLA